MQTKKRATSQKKKNEGQSGRQSGSNVATKQSGPSVATGQPKRNRGRPPKAKNTSVLPPPPPLPPPDLGLFISSVDGHTYMSTANDVIRVSDSQV